MLLRGGIHGQKLDGLKGDFTVGHAEIDNKHDWANDGFIDIAMTTLIEFRTSPCFRSSPQKESSHVRPFVYGLSLSPRAGAVNSFHAVVCGPTIQVIDKR